MGLDGGWMAKSLGLLEYFLSFFDLFFSRKTVQF